MVGVRGSQSAGGGDRNGDARRGARSPHVWRAVRDAYNVNSGGRRVERGRRAAEARGARRAARHERGGARCGALRAARKEQGQVGNGAPCGVLCSCSNVRDGRRRAAEASGARRENSGDRGGKRGRRAAEARGAQSVNSRGWVGAVRGAACGARRVISGRWVESGARRGARQAARNQQGGGSGAVRGAALRARRTGRRMARGV